MLWNRILHHADRDGTALALRDRHGHWTYAGLCAAVEDLASTLPDRVEGHPVEPGQRIALLCTPGMDWLRAFLAVLKTGHIAVPLALVHPPAEWRYVLEDAECGLLLASSDLAEHIQPTAEALGIAVQTLDAPTLHPEAFPSAWPSATTAIAETPAFIIYTSGSTGKPKGVLHTQGSLQAQVEALSQAWEWRSDDGILNVLPLHHIHGMVNVYASAMWNGAAIRELHGFDADKTWTAFGEAMSKGSSPLDEAAETEPSPSLFMAVPTVYQKLLQHAEGFSPEAREAAQKACSGFRLMVSGSAALPVPLLQAWEALSGQRLLERYGMSEIGMGLSQLLDGTRHPGTVGLPLPGVECRIVPLPENERRQEAGAEGWTGENGTGLESSDPDTASDRAPDTVPDAVTGELQVRGPALFARYWGRPEATDAAFAEGWFKTGDVVERFRSGPMQGHYRILGRNSVDILKSGGYKISALEVEAALLAHPAIREAAVIGLEDPEWGERIAAALVLDQDHALLQPLRGTSASQASSAGPHQEALVAEWRAFLGERLAPYKMPREYRYMAALPRNALGKVVKPRLKAAWETMD